MTFRKVLRLAALPLMLGLAGCATTGDLAANGAAAFDRGDADPAIWVIKDADTTIYLFGTIHLLKPDLVWFDDAVKTAFDASDELVLEMVEPDAATMQQVIMARAMASDGIALRDRLDDAQRTRYDAALGQMGMAPATFDKLKPWAAAITLSTMPMQKLGFDPDAGVEKIVANGAKSGGKKIAAVETFDEQIGFFDALPVADQIAFLMATIDGLPDLAKETARMERDWATGDVADLAALLNEGLKTTPTLGKILLADRNARWAAWLDERMKQPGTVFMAVGAGHLAGDASVQAYLAQRGIVATRIDY
ncbi:TraB/GumN family protein [Sphingorhabdus soli]|uniref:TraB/GumN family protein n=1 Tax=Flavisphingopyxis soli TaxID=2601267 RepID=A0A5C6U7M1_9SPHN|nr:TraB/GumN family protein [Sphingorhabdus soli]TXC68849.1 TraB/GumN family protein [Sphingorhabdus soli]